MPKQTPSTTPRRPAAPYHHQPARTRSTGKTSDSMMSHPLQAAAPAAPHTHHHPRHHLQQQPYPQPQQQQQQQQQQPQQQPQQQQQHHHHQAWQQQNAASMQPPPTGGFTSRMPPAERTIPPSPGTPATPGLGRQSSSANNPSGPWSGQDDEVLLQARAQSHGWGKIQKDHFPSKTPNACRKRYERLVAKRRGSDWTDARVDRVAGQYMRMREQTWRPLADAVGEDWQDVEKFCLERGARSLLLPLGQRDTQRAGSEHGSRASHDSHEDERVSIHNLIQ